MCLSVLLTCFSIAVCCLFEQIYDDDDDIEQYEVGALAVDRFVPNVSSGTVPYHPIDRYSATFRRAKAQGVG